MLMPAATRWPLGATGIATSGMALGCARLGSALTPLDRQQSIALLRQAHALGVRHFDTASIYGQGDSERLLGEALAPYRDSICLASKAGQLLTPRQAVLAQFKPLVRWVAARRQGVHARVAQARAQGVPRCFEPGHIERSLRASLQRLRTDHLDLFYLHSPAPEVLDDEALFARLEQLQRQGLFTALGVSCDDLALAQRAATHACVQVVQFEFDGSAPAQAVADELARQGKAAVLRGLARWRAGAGDAGDAGVVRGLRQMLALPSFGGVLVGTTDTGHLQHNLGAFQRALALHDTA
ncbi:aldo/keto reductase [Pseudorhodoferax sp.]|uniref:aldo/keto reductase n=1 Tax=Pseudorhodoferax sp. TaxID=1993553 RepID=UPI002DD64C7B|nr:aldo/keto reductase [Pseudorhodoferax sp.]